MATSYEAAWNLNVRTNNGLTTTFAVNAKNELSSVGGTGCTYDSNGNLTSDGTRSFSYNDENQPTSVSSGTTYRYDFVYGGLARLRKKLTYIWSSGSWSLYQETRYVYDGRLVLQERNSSGDTPEVAYTRGWDMSASFQGAGGIGGMLARSHGYSAGSWTTHHAYHTDGNGNITALVSTAQAISASYKYDPFGNLISSSGAMAGANTYRFSSKMTELNSGLYYYGFRFYHPNLQRWLNQDPMEETGGNNLYCAFLNDPIASYDPFGLLNTGPFLSPNQIEAMRTLLAGGTCLAATPAAPVVLPLIGGAAVGFGIAYVADRVLPKTPMGFAPPYPGGARRNALPNLSITASLQSGVALDPGEWQDAQGFVHDAGNIVRDADGRTIGGPREAESDKGRKMPAGVGTGPFARESIPARSSARDFTDAEREAINGIGRKAGCHTCGTNSPSTKSGNFIPDHQPPSALNPNGGPQCLYPQCLRCSRDQGLAIARLLNR